jgi:hypothetical protein
MTTTTDKQQQQITILFEPRTYEIIRIFDIITGKILIPVKVSATGNNVYNWAKAIKPAPAQFGDLSSFLMAIKRHTPDGVVYKFSNNGNFLTEYLLGTTYSSYKLGRYFEISYSTSGNYHALLVSFTIHRQFVAHRDENDRIGIESHVSGTIIDFKNSSSNITTAAQLRHELINPLNAIKLSGDQIRRHIRENGVVSVMDIDKFNNIILNEVVNSLDIIDTLYNENIPNRNQSISLEKIPLTTFNSYIQKQLELINQTYFMFAPVRVDWPTENLDTNYILTHYVCVNTNYMKIILNNIFKNIYGHLDSSSSLCNTFIQPESYTDKLEHEPFNKFTILINGNEIQLRISNKIKTPRVDKTGDCKIGTANWRKNKSAQSVIDKYNLVVDYQETSSVLEQTPKSVTIHNKSKHNMGIGLTLINNLCQKMDVKWNLVDNDTEICFILAIPVLSDTRHLGHFYHTVNTHVQSVAQCVL